MKKPYLLVGEIVKPQGIRGEVKVRHYTDDPQRFKELQKVYIQKNGAYEPVRVLSSRVQQDDVFLLLEGTADRNAAEALRGTQLWVDRANAVELREDQVFIADIIGAKAVDSNGCAIGTLREVLSPCATDVYVFDTPRGTLMVPALKSVLLEVNADEDRIVLDAEGLKEVGLYEDGSSQPIS